MAKSKSTTHPSETQGRAITTTPLRSLAPVLEIPNIPEYPPSVLQIFEVTNLELRMLFELERADGMKPEELSPSELKLIQGLHRGVLVDFAERVNRWRLSRAGETILGCVRLFLGAGGETRPLKPAKVLLFPSRTVN